MIKIKYKHIRLPVEYQEVEYIESSGSQYIDTGVVPTGLTKIDADINILSTNTTNQWKCIFGARDYPNGDWYTHRFLCLYFRFANNELDLNHNYAEADNYTQTSVMTPDTRFNVVLNAGTAYINGNLISSMSTTTKTFNTSWHNLNIYLFNNHIWDNDVHKEVIQDRGQKVRIYKFKIYDDNGVLIRHYVPCYRKSDNIIGMYDLINDTFNINNGTGTFIKGSDVPSQRTVKKITTKVNGIMKNIEYIKTKVNDTMETVFDKVPSTYTRYDYIWVPQNSGSSTDPRLSKPTGSLIKLKQYSNLDLISYELDFICSQTYPSNFNVSLLGGRSASGVTNSLACYISGQYKVMVHYHGIEKTTNLTYSLNNKTRAKYQNTSTSPSQLIVNGNSEDLVWTNTVSISNTGPHLFGNPTPNDLSSMSNIIPVTVKTKIGKIKVYDLSGNLINNYVPCVRKSDNVIGMYDTVGGVFYTAYQATYATIGSSNCSYEVGNW